MAEKIWLVYSRYHNAFWGPDNRGYFVDIDSAGRYTQEAAAANCRNRSLTIPNDPQEVMVIAPEVGQRLKDLLGACGAAVELVQHSPDCNTRSYGRDPTCNCGVAAVKAKLQAAVQVEAPQASDPDAAAPKMRTYSQEIRPYTPEEWLKKCGEKIIFGSGTKYTVVSVSKHHVHLDDGQAYLPAYLASCARFVNNAPCGVVV